MRLDWNGLFRHKTHEHTRLCHILSSIACFFCDKRQKRCRQLCRCERVKPRQCERAPTRPERVKPRHRKSCHESDASAFQLVGSFGASIQLQVQSHAAPTRQPSASGAPRAFRSGDSLRWRRGLGWGTLGGEGRWPDRRSFSSQRAETEVLSTCRIHVLMETTVQVGHFSVFHRKICTCRTIPMSSTCSAEN